MTGFTWMPGDVVRIHGRRTAFKVLRINLDDTVDLLGPNGRRTVFSSKIAPPQPGDADKVRAFDSLSQAAPARRAGAR